MLGLDTLVAKPLASPDLVVYAVTLAEVKETVKEKTMLKLSYEFLPRAESMWKLFRVTRTPLAIIIDKKGIIRYRSGKLLKDEQVDTRTNTRVELVKRLLREEAG